jgi:methionine salvage enolase-phosphatase E1
MKYILDFDEVLFNTTALKEKMEELGISEVQRDISLLETIFEKDPNFKMEDLVFPNALEFLKEHGKDCIVVSSASSIKSENNTNQEAQKEFQLKKIVLSGIGELVEDVRVVGAEKKEALSKIMKEFGEELVFLDDQEVYIREAQELGIKSVWMDREGKGHLTGPEGVPTMLEFPRVGNFAEFVKYITTCKETQE